MAAIPLSISMRVSKCTRCPPWLYQRKCIELHVRFVALCVRESVWMYTINSRIIRPTLGGVARRRPDFVQWISLNVFGSMGAHRAPVNWTSLHLQLIFIIIIIAVAPSFVDAVVPSWPSHVKVLAHTPNGTIHNIWCTRSRISICRFIRNHFSFGAHSKSVAVTVKCIAQNMHIAHFILWMRTFVYIFMFYVLSIHDRASGYGYECRRDWKTAAVAISNREQNACAADTFCRWNRLQSVMLMLACVYVCDTQHDVSRPFLFDFFFSFYAEYVRFSYAQCTCTPREILETEKFIIQNRTSILYSIGFFFLLCSCKTQADSVTVANFHVLSLIRMSYGVASCLAWL